MNKSTLTARSPQKVSGVYAIESTDGRMYIGSSVNIEKRWSEHKSRLRNGRHANQILASEVANNGLDSLKCKILLRCSPENLRLYEQRAIDVMKPTLNVLKTAERYLTEHWKRPEFRARNSARAKAHNAALWNDPAFVEKAKERVSAMQTDAVKEKSLEGRRKAMAARGEAYQNVAKSSSATFKRLHADPEFAKAHSERMRQEMLARCKDKEFCRRRDKAAAEANKKPIRCITTGQVFPSKNEAAQALGISVSLISKQLRGLPTRTKLQWEYLNG